MKSPTGSLREAHRKLYDAPDKLADLAVLFFREHPRLHRKCAGKMHASSEENNPGRLCRPDNTVDMVFENDSAEELAKQPWIIAPNVHMISAGELARLASYVRAGRGG